MKKMLCAVLALTLVLSLAACGGDGAGETTAAPVETTAPVVTEAPLETSAPAETEAPVETTAPAVDASATVTVLSNIWDKYAEEEMFSVFGGNIETGIMDMPGAWDMAYAENMTYNLLVPAEQLANVAEAASLIHAMNANNFTCGAFSLTEGADEKAFADAMQAAVQGNMWMCGFPETLVIAVVDGTVVVAFGVNDLMTPFQTHLTEAYAEAEILYNEPIVG